MKKPRIKRAQQPFCYWVESRNRPEVHQVDLTQRVAYGCAHGACTCEFFQFQARKNLKKAQGKRIPYLSDEDGKCLNSHSATECYHITRARDYVVDRFLMPLLATMEAGPTPEFLALLRSLKA